MLKFSGLFSPDFLFKFHTATFQTWNVPVPKAHVLKMAPSLGYWEVVGVRLYEQSSGQWGCVFGKTSEDPLLPPFHFLFPGFEVNLVCSESPSSICPTMD